MNQYRRKFRYRKWRTRKGDLETKTEFPLVTNLPTLGEAAVSDDEIRDIYRLRWGVELLCKFLKMHLKLDK